jgi:hypothetical protein
MPTVSKVRKERANDHDHIQGVCTTEGTYYVRAAVVASINGGTRWVTSGGGVIRPITFCPVSGCAAAPYITTRPDNSIDNNLESLPRC